MTGKTYMVDVQEDDDGEAFIQFPDEMMAELGWVEGDTLHWNDNGDGSFLLTKVPGKPKVETQWVEVVAISTFRQKYMVEVPKGQELWALDTVTCGDAKEFSQEHLGEQIVCHRVVSEDDILTMCDLENSYVADWSPEKKMDTFCTPWTEPK